MSGADAAELSSQIASVTRSGLPLAQGLAALAAELPRGGLRRSIEDLATKLERRDAAGRGGENPRRAACRRICAGCSWRGLRSGELGELLDRFYEYLNIGVDLKRKLWLAPGLPGAHRRWRAGAPGIRVPVSGRAIRGDLPRLRHPTAGHHNCTADRFRTRFRVLLVPVGILLGVISMCMAGRSRFPAARPAAQHGVQAAAPGRRVALDVACRVLPLARAAGERTVPMSEALRLTGQGIEDASIDQDCRVMAGRVELGESLSGAMAARPRFPIGLARLLRWAENQKSVPEVLHMAGSMFEARAVRSRRSWASSSISCACSWSSAWCWPCRPCSRRSSP